MRMSKANKAALLSAFVFPGAGLFVVKQKMVGFFVALVALINLSVIGSVISANIEYRFNRLLTSMNSLSGNPSLDLTASLSPSDAEALQFSALIFSLLWLFTIYDSYRRGRLLDHIEEIRQLKQAEADQKSIH